MDLGTADRRARVAVARSNFDPETRRGATGGSPPPLLTSFASCPAIDPCRSLASMCPYARSSPLSCSTPLQPVCSCLQPVRCARARHRDLNRWYARCRLFGSCTYLHVRGFLRRCGCPRAGISAGRRASCRPARTFVEEVGSHTMLAWDIQTDDVQRQRAEPAGNGGGDDAAGSS